MERGNALVRQTPFRQNDVAMDLALTLQRLYDSEINVTITMLWDGGFDFALISYMEWGEAGRPLYVKVIASVEPIIRPDRPDPWRSWRRQFMTLLWASIRNRDTRSVMEGWTEPRLDEWSGAPESLRCKRATHPSFLELATQPLVT